MYQASDIAEFALRFAGVTTIYDTAPDPEQFEVTLKHLNLLMAEKRGINKLWPDVPSQQEVLLEAGVTEYDLDIELSDDTQLAIVTDAHLVNVTTGKIEKRLTLLRRWEFNDLYDPTESAAPTNSIYVERKTSPKLYVMPPPLDDTYKVVLDGLTYPDDLTQSGGNVAIGLPDAWARWAALECAVDIGSGAVVALPPARITRLERMAALAYRRLRAFNNRENVQGGRHTKPRAF